MVILRTTPLKGDRIAEGLRHSVGLTIKDHQVTVVLVDGAVLATLPLEPETVGAPVLAKHLETLNLLGQDVWAEQESLERWCPGQEPGFGVRVVPRGHVEEVMLASDAVIPF